MIICTFLFGCSGKVARKKTDTTQTFTNISTFNSVIEGSIISISPVDKSTTGNIPCDKTPCNAKVKIISIKQNGQNYHGQFSEGDIIDMHFDFTLSSTKELFPELNKHMPGLDVGTIFVAELFEHPDTDLPYRIKLYEVKK